MKVAFRSGAAAVLGALAVTSASASEVATAPPLPPRIGPCGLGNGFLLPGTEACLTLSGFVRGEGSWSITPATYSLPVVPVGAPRELARPVPGLNQSALGTSARLSADVRVPTELGPVRVFVSLRGHKGNAVDRTAR